MLLEYKIDNEIIDVDVSDNQNYITGESKVLSNVDTDITFNQNWYSEGYTTAPFLWNEEFGDLKKGITNTISDLLTKEGIDTTGFTLEKYHKYVNTNEQHFSIVSKTRDLFPDQFRFNINE